MNKAIAALSQRLSFGVHNHLNKEEAPFGFVETLAGVYEKPETPWSIEPTIWCGGQQLREF
jgi:hypothetical protein